MRASAASPSTAPRAPWCAGWLLRAAGSVALLLLWSGCNSIPIQLPLNDATAGKKDMGVPLSRDGDAAKPDAPQSSTPDIGAIPMGDGGLSDGAPGDGSTAPTEMGPTEMGPTEMGPAEMGSAEAGPAEAGPADAQPPIEQGPKLDL